LLDEPTSALAPSEIDAFFATIVRLVQRGTAVMIVTHKLQEVIAYSKRVSVMRHGKIVARFETADTNVNEIASAMVGGHVPDVAEREPTQLQPRFAIRTVTAGEGSQRLDGISFEVRSGEIVGIAGVEGNGQTTLADAIAGVIPFDGTIVRGAQTSIIPQDRHREALVLKWSLADNTLLGRQRQRNVRSGAVIDRKRVREDTQRIVERFDVRAANIDVSAGTLSGGNQQKLVVGRALIDDPEFVLAYQPTRGIDVGAAALVQSRLMEARNSGAAVLLISFELDEIFTLADRILVMYRGAIAGEFARERADRARIGSLMAGGS